MITLGLACCCDEQIIASGPTLIHANEVLHAAGWAWRTGNGLCRVRCPECRVRPNERDKSALTIMEWRDDQVEIVHALIEK